MKNVTKLFAVCAAVGFAVGLPLAASAKEQRYSGAFCTAIATQTSMGNPNVKAPFLNDSTAINSDVSHGLRGGSGGDVWNDMMCPIVTTDYMNHSSIKLLNLHGRSPSVAGRFQAKACWTSWSGSAGTCTSAQNSTAGDGAAISFSNPSGVFSVGGGSGSDFPYVYVRLLNSTSLGPALLRGYFTSDI